MSLLEFLDCKLLGKTILEENQKFAFLEVSCCGYPFQLVGSRVASPESFQTAAIDPDDVSVSCSSLLSACV